MKKKMVERIKFTPQ